MTKALRTHRPDGSGLTADGITVAPPDGLMSVMTKLVEKLNDTGVGCAQFLSDPRDRVGPGSTGINFLEINPRMGVSVAAIRGAGLELRVAAVELAAGKRPTQNQGRDHLGMRFSWVYGDLSGLVGMAILCQLSIRQPFGWIVAAANTTVRFDLDLVWSWKDPAPTLGVLSSGLRECWELIRERVFHSSTNSRQVARQAQA